MQDSRKKSFQLRRSASVFGPPSDVCRNARREMSCTGGLASNGSLVWQRRERRKCFASQRRQRNSEQCSLVQRGAENKKRASSRDFCKTYCNPQDFDLMPVSCSRPSPAPAVRRCWQSHSKTTPVASLLHCFAAVTSAAAETRTRRCMLPVANPVLQLRGVDGEDLRIRQGIELWFCFRLTKL